MKLAQMCDAGHLKCPGELRAIHHCIAALLTGLAFIGASRISFRAAGALGLRDPMTLAKAVESSGMLSP